LKHSVSRLNAVSFAESIWCVFTTTTTTITTTTTTTTTNNNNNNLSQLLTMLETNYRLTPGCHDGGPSPFDSYDTYLRIVRHSKPMISDFV